MEIELQKAPKIADPLNDYSSNRFGSLATPIRSTLPNSRK